MTFGLLIGLLLLVGAGSLVTSEVADDMRAQVSRLQPVLRENQRLHDQVSLMTRAVRTYLLTGDPAARSGYREMRSAPYATLAEAQRIATAADRRNLAAQERQLDAYLKVADQQAKSSPRTADAGRLTVEAARRFTAFEMTNQRLEDRLTDDIRRLEDRAETFVDGTSAATGALLGVSAALAVFAAVRTTRALTGPLQSTALTLDRLASGDHTARAQEVGPEEIRAVAQSVNALADESDRLRAIEQERARLTEMARAVGVRIREMLDEEHILESACAGLGDGLKADRVFILLTEEDEDRVRVAQAWAVHTGLLPPEEQPIPPVPLDVVRDHCRRGTAWCLNDLPAAQAGGSPLPGAPGSYGERGLPQDARAAAERLGLTHVLVAPFGVGEKRLGVVLLARTRMDHPWRPVEIECAESIAAGVGRALHTAYLYREESHLVEKLRALDKTKSDFLSTVSHELRTPLTSIVGYVELLKDDETGPLTQPQRHMLDIVDRNANRLRTLIEDLLTLSRIESGTFGSHRQPVDLCHLVASAADATRQTAHAASVTLETHCPIGPLILEADGDQLDRVLMNLLSNAVKFTPKGGKVTVRAEARDGEVILSVSDTGIGIPAAEQDKLFQRFFRASNATEAAIPGTGLGLTIVRTIVANHGGEMQVHSEEGRGTTVSARLPTVTAQEAASSP